MENRVSKKQLKALKKEQTMKQNESNESDEEQAEEQQVQREEEKKQKITVEELANEMGELKELLKLLITKQNEKEFKKREEVEQVKDSESEKSENDNEYQDYEQQSEEMNYYYKSEQLTANSLAEALLNVKHTAPILSNLSFKAIKNFIKDYKRYKMNITNPIFLKRMVDCIDGDVLEEMAAYQGEAVEDIMKLQEELLEEKLYYKHRATTVGDHSEKLSKHVKYDIKKLPTLAFSEYCKDWNMTIKALGKIDRPSNKQYIKVFLNNLPNGIAEQVKQLDLQTLEDVKLRVREECVKQEEFRKECERKNLKMYGYNQSKSNRNVKSQPKIQNQVSYNAKKPTTQQYSSKIPICGYCTMGGHETADCLIKKDDISKGIILEKNPKVSKRQRERERKGNYVRSNFNGHAAIVDSEPEHTSHGYEESTSDNDCEEYDCTQCTTVLKKDPVTKRINVPAMMGEFDGYMLPINCMYDPGSTSDFVRGEVIEVLRAKGVKIKVINGGKAFIKLAKDGVTTEIAARRAVIDVRLMVGSEPIEFKMTPLIWDDAVAPVILGLPICQRYDLSKYIKLDDGDYNMFGPFDKETPEEEVISKLEADKNYFESELVNFHHVIVSEVSESVNIGLNGMMDKLDVSPIFRGNGKLKEILAKHLPILTAPLDEEGMKVPPMQIYLKEGSETFVSPYRYVPNTDRLRLKEDLEKLVKIGILREVHDATYSSPLVLIRKKDGSLRIAVDYRRLNELILPYAGTIPNMRELFAFLAGKKYYARLDNVAGFHQLKVDENSRKYTVISTPFGLYEWTRVPFGIKTAPGTYQQRMDNFVLKGLLGTAAICYIDDTLVVGETEEEFLKNLDLVLSALKKFNVRLKVEHRIRINTIFGPSV